MDIKKKSFQNFIKYTRPWSHNSYLHRTCNKPDMLPKMQIERLELIILIDFLDQIYLRNSRREKTHIWRTLKKWEMQLDNSKNFIIMITSQCHRQSPVHSKAAREGLWSTWDNKWAWNSMDLTDSWSLRLTISGKEIQKIQFKILEFLAKINWIT